MLKYFKSDLNQMGGACWENTSQIIGGRQQSWRAAGGGRSGRTHWLLPRAGVRIEPALASLIKARPSEKEEAEIKIPNEKGKIMKNISIF